MEEEKDYEVYKHRPNPDYLVQPGKLWICPQSGDWTINGCSVELKIGEKIVIQRGVIQFLDRPDGHNLEEEEDSE